mmetsp:Transcript_4593/g.16444  ORF Transcript_4593/g.16444 Transcript_4593/m.16444 type:complete len:209 (+) Transcript_4593:2461-3087(+)
MPGWIQWSLREFLPFFLAISSSMSRSSWLFLPFWFSCFTVFVASSAPAKTEALGGPFTLFCPNFLPLSKPKARVSPSVRFSSVASFSTTFAFLAALSACWATERCRRCSSLSSCLSLFSFCSLYMIIFGSSSTYVMNHPLGVFSTTHLPLSPRYFTNSVNVVHFVEFMWIWFLSAINSLYTFLASIRVDLCDILKWSRKACSNTFEYP